MAVVGKLLLQMRIPLIILSWLAAAAVVKATTLEEAAAVVDF
jgi:hypothetical protein